MIYIYVVIGLIWYFCAGLGAAIAEQQINQGKMNMATFMLWPIALVVWAIYGEV